MKFKFRRPKAKTKGPHFKFKIPKTFGKTPKNKTQVWVKQKKVNQSERAEYQYSIIQSKDSRLRTFDSREEAIIEMNKIKEKQPGMKYKVLAEKRPRSPWGL